MTVQANLVVGAVVLALLGGAGWYIHHSAQESVRTELTQKYNDELEKARKEAKASEDALEAELLSTRKERNERVQALNSVVKSLRDELRSRPNRPTDSSPAPSSGTTCTGAQLYREDAEFLAGEAARADRIMIERDFYYNAYENARKELKRLHEQGQK